MTEKPNNTDAAKVQPIPEVIQARIENIDPEEMQKRAGEQKYLDAMKYVPDSLTREFGK